LTRALNHNVGVRATFIQAPQMPLVDREPGENGGSWQDARKRAGRRPGPYATDRYPLSDALRVDTSPRSSQEDKSSFVLCREPRAASDLTSCVASLASEATTACNDPRRPSLA
jgi:hypothetical protein